ncbi:MAG: ATP-binding protein [Chloroflexi bacterium]|nr:ATP-binding protein [Chloroflexota bacterium]MBU1750426.1 ATP-binding protein [Chloroflexota bacterium]
MSAHIIDDSDFEDHLPPGQALIETSNVRRFKAFIDLILHPQQKYATMGVVTGKAGMGKTIAIQAYLDSMKPRLHNGLPAAIRVKVEPRSTPKALALDIMSTLGDVPIGSNTREVILKAKDAIKDNDLKLLFVDEGDWLREDSFEVLRRLFDKTGCPIVVVGLPHILEVIDRHQKFASRVGLRMEFSPLRVEEILDTVLPRIMLPHWEFDPRSEADRVLGERIWKMVSPSLRKLRNLIQTASLIAESFGVSRITSDLIEQAFRWSATQEDKRRLAQGLKSQADDPQDQSGELERVSERRHESKERKDRGPSVL